MENSNINNDSNINDNTLHRFQEQTSHTTMFYTIVDGMKYFEKDPDNFSWGNLMQRLEKPAAQAGYTIYSGQYVERDPYLNTPTMQYVNVGGDKQLMSGQLMLLRSNSNPDGFL
jgi:hypothetical protein